MKKSKPTLAVMLSLVCLGFIAGISSYAGRSSIKATNDPAANAIMVHVILGIVALIGTVYVVIVNKRHNQPSLLLAPFTERAFSRVKATLGFRSGFSFVSLLRFLASLLLLYLLLWEPFRAAMQPIAALDPNFTANAWGGPSYAGATLAHWVDGLLLFYLTALLLHVVLVRAPSVSHAKN